MNDNNFYCGSSSNLPCQLARLDQVPAQYVHPATKVCNYSYTHPNTKQCSGGDASTLNGLNAEQLLSQIKSGSIYVRRYTGNCPDGLMSQTFPIPFYPSVLIIFREDGFFSNGSNITSYPFGIVTPSNPYFYIRDTKYGIHLNPSNTVTVSNVTNYQTAGFNLSGKAYVILAIS